MPGYDPLQAGLYVPMDAPFTTGISSLALTASRAHFMRFVCPRSMTITKMAFPVNIGATVDDQCDLGIVSADMATLLGSSGAVSGKLNVGATGNSVCNLQAGVPLVAGQVYYAAFAHGPIGGTAAQLYCTTLTGNLGQLPGGTAGVIEQTWQASKFPLAAPFAPTGAIGSCPILALLQ